MHSLHLPAAPLAGLGAVIACNVELRKPRLGSHLSKAHSQSMAGPELKGCDPNRYVTGPCDQLHHTSVLLLP